MQVIEIIKDKVYLKMQGNTIEVSSVKLTLNERVKTARMYLASINKCNSTMSVDADFFNIRNKIV